MKKIYTSYFQKSKVFLYPLLGIKKGVRFVPLQTYISWNDRFKEGSKLLCHYSINKDDPGIIQQFKVFEENELKRHEFYEEHYILDKLGDGDIYVFNMDFFKKDLKKFKEGKYSEFSLFTKEVIMSFFGDIGTISEYVESYIYPEKYYEIYSQILNIPINILTEVKELCKPDLKKEDLKKDMIELELFK
jgi:hypothetical protein